MQEKRSQRSVASKLATGAGAMHMGASYPSGVLRQSIRPNWRSFRPLK